MPSELTPVLMHLKISAEARALLVCRQCEVKEGAWFTPSSPISAFTAQSPCWKCLAPLHYSHTKNVSLSAFWLTMGRAVAQGSRQHHRALHRNQRYYQVGAGFSIITYHPVILMFVGCTKLPVLFAKIPQSTTKCCSTCPFSSYTPDSACTP